MICGVELNLSCLCEFVLKYYVFISMHSSFLDVIYTKMTQDPIFAREFKDADVVCICTNMIFCSLSLYRHKITLYSFVSIKQRALCDIYTIM